MKIGLGLHLPVTGQDKKVGNYANPTLNSITPNSGPEGGGYPVVLEGSDFQDNTQVSFGLTWVVGTLVDSQHMTATTPAEPGAGTVGTQLNAPDGGFCTGPSYTFVPPPVITSITPNVGLAAGGIPITDLAGTGFLPGCSVTFDGVPAISVVRVSSTKITCVTPAHAAGAVDVVVTNPDVGTQNSGASGAGIFTYL